MVHTHSATTPQWRPRNRRVLVFSIAKAERFRGSKLYRPRQNVGAFSEAREVWVLRGADDCRLGPVKGQWEPGLKALVHDGLELDPTHLDLWPENCERPEFRDLAKLALEMGAQVDTELVSEISILGLLFDEGEPPCA